MFNETCKQLQNLVTTAGGLNFKTNLTKLPDGYPGHKRSIPVYPLFRDVYKGHGSSNTIHSVMKNDRPYNVNTPDEIYPAGRKPERSEWPYERPENGAGLKD